MLNIVIPMAGAGARFKEKGYTFPKPLIEVNGKPMIQVVVENIRPKTEHRFSFICRKEHLNQCSLEYMLNTMAPHCNIVTVGQLTEGAACTVLLASQYFNNKDELILANSDQYVDMAIDDFIEDSRSRKLDGNILTFPASHPRWSYANINKEGFVTEVAEKKPIGPHATVGIYYYCQGKMFFEAAAEMIKKDLRVNNEFYVCPAYNEMILKGLRIGIYEIPISKMHGLGTPEDLEKFERSEMFKKV